MPLNKPPLHEVHRGAGADFTDFGGWEMPVKFDSIRSEHAAVRESVGIFDVSHMSEVVVTGPDATAIMDRLTTNDVQTLDSGDAQYSCILDEEGVILDDTVVYRYPDGDGYLFVPNAGHGEQMAERWSQYASEFGLSVTVENQTDSTGLVAVQGPDSVETVEAVTSDPVGELSQFSWRQTEIAAVECHVARTGYTGEDGYEIFFPASDSEAVWEAFEDIQPCGLGARDTLRLEAGLLLSGQDFDPEDEPRTPLEAGLGFVVDLSKDEFVGRETLQDLEEAGVEERMVGIRIDERAIARHGYSILADGTEIGHVTSGTMGPTLNVPIALGYVETPFAETGTEIEVEVRGEPVEATVVDQRFLDSLESN
ncbi:glycine cleavage system T protein (plasmid) [Haloterrigena turkmenica DSM 5511]|uniref:Probable aminomethyltransferase n=1 Tax=Haloterrigena turkmenica (strain ATCC 51198 / DSM 5511 / JCM 9101 / NCIMB 13204 / VKM B-1734 / 4k) TaxID=543526 RepID=D2S0R8_HALTV|nr:glycine cleavage system aminomethyltransferase GcvT [Haloterrigena turkmenica]ADB62965.1 glycine cleavage system T protein [Haloterrigena turkmenica DSM 5511]